VPGTRPVIRLSDTTGSEYDSLRIRLAGSAKRIPTNPQTVSALVKLAELHYDDAVALVKTEMGII